MAYDDPIPRCPDGKTYNSPCRCDFCRSIKTLRMKEYRLRRLESEAGAVFPDTLIDVGPIRRKLRNAIDNDGVRLTYVAEFVGMQRMAISKIYHGKTSFIKQANADKISTVIDAYDEQKFKDQTLVSCKRSRQILLSLCAQGWTLDHQREIVQNNLHINGGFILSITSGKWLTTTKKNEDTILWLAKAVGEKTGPSKALPSRMKTRGVFPVKHYDGVGDLLVQSLTRDQRASVQ